MENTFWCEDECGYDCTRTDAGTSDSEQCQNIASRMSQKEALAHAQASFFVAIVIVQWADLVICKTRWLSIRTQGMGNSFMNFGLFFETLLAAWLAYCPPINIGLGTRNLRLVHWFPAMPFSVSALMALSLSFRFSEGSNTIYCSHPSSSLKLKELNPNICFLPCFGCLKSVQMLIFVYDELRKYLMRTTSPELIDKSTGQARRIAGWLERNTYY